MTASYEKEDTMPSDMKGALTVKEFCAQYKIGLTKAYDMIANGELRAVKIGSLTRLLAKDVLAWEKSLLVKD